MSCDRRRMLTGLSGVLVAGAAHSVFPSAGRSQPVKELQALKPGEFTWHPDRSPEGPVAIIVSIPEQRVHVYRNGIRIAVSTCSTGAPGHSTPVGVFTILEKDKNHRSSTYSNAPMPNMNRLTWSGIAIHAGNLPGYPASHGCIRLPMKFSELLFGITHVGTPVILAGTASDPKEVSHPGLVLGDYASHEFVSVKEGLAKKELPWAAHITSYSAPTSILVSGADRKGYLIVDGEISGEAPVSILNPSVPIGSHVFMLVGASEARQGLSWHAIAHHEMKGVPLGAPEESVLTRLQVDDGVRARVREHMHPGMTLITTDLPAHRDTRTGRDFVVMSQEDA